MTEQENTPEKLLFQIVDRSLPDTVLVQHIENILRALTVLSLPAQAEVVLRDTYYLDLSEFLRENGFTDPQKIKQLLKDARLFSFHGKGYLLDDTASKVGFEVLSSAGPDKFEEVRQSLIKVLEQGKQIYLSKGNERSVSWYEEMLKRARNIQWTPSDS